MSWSQRQAEGFALAATIAGDRGAERARPGLVEPAQHALLSVAVTLAALPKHARRMRIRDIVHAVAALPGQGNRSPRALGLLGARLPRAVAQTLVPHLTLPRAGYIPEPGLCAWLWRLAQQPCAPLLAADTVVQAPASQEGPWPA